jgi:hypothetical protein
MDRSTAVMTWRDVCGSDAVMSIGLVTGSMLEEFARRIEEAERERCAIFAHKDAARLDWLANRLEDVEIDGADPLEHYQDENGDDEPWPILWRRAIDAAMGGQP